MKDRFLSMCSQITRPHTDQLIKWLEDSDFFTAPASRRNHGSYKGGLLEHSLNVYDEFKRILSVYPEINVSEETIKIVTLFHDLCKVNYYSLENGFYEINESFHFGGHGSKSVYLIQQFIDLLPMEAAAINCHMGSWDGNKGVGDTFQQYPVAWLLHVADESATYFKERG